MDTVNKAGITIDNVSFSFDDKKVLDNVSLVLNETPTIILGPSGCGKTTLLRLIAGLLQPQSGAIHFDKRFGGEHRVSFVFQEPRLLPYLSVLENITLPSRKHIPQEELHQKAQRLLTLTGLENEARRYPGELSGGQSQRVSIVRAFCYPAPLVLMDEPFQSLDLLLRFALLETLKTLLAAENRFLVAVTHDPREAVMLGKRILVLGKNGCIAFDTAAENRDPAALEREILRGLTSEQ
ncbi:MAG: ATP-binding cassette domain-containing protein [Spirochaetaceae bacterium]|jgi:NitT/TauT family transport system ATP-binding protein|nr:ATP-binding cassette domain-containing protein [Spirochaetaceae bacterium]